MNGRMIAIVSVVVSILVLGVLILIAGGERTTQLEEDLVSFAEQVGIEDTDKFLEDYKSDEIRNRVEQDKEDILAIIGQASTPTVLINGQRQDLNTIGNAELFTETLNTLIEIQGEGADPIVVEIYEDMTCPACANFFPEALLTEIEFSEDQVVFERKHLPFRIESTSYAYAYAIEAAALQGQKLAYTKLVFEEVNNDLNYSSIENIEFIDDKPVLVTSSLEDSLDEDVQNNGTDSEVESTEEN